ncbi:hypothetical protein TRVA0_003S04830 [Trichomonascus vanleenenianus]|uniref:uncharacterized protein n=1 Tax=Trichomonascus vanleenenianus TaxID=2268995 RepID=UPI003EC9B50D
MDTTGTSFYVDIALLTLQAVSQTVIVCLFGFLAARYHILTPSVQRHVSTLNVYLFTPCLVFNKLAGSLSLKALIDIAIIPVLFVITTGISYACARVTSRIMKLSLPETNFVTAMAVFGNSNSLPVSLTVSLAYTLPNLAWPDLPNDNPDDVASRGILYLLIFQQLGQIIRWSWGYNTLLAPQPIEVLEQQGPSDEESRLLIGQAQTYNTNGQHRHHAEDAPKPAPKVHVDPLQSGSSSGSSSTLSMSNLSSSSSTDWSGTAATRQSLFETHPALKLVKRFYDKVVSFLNPPIWAMLLAIIVASVPSLKYYFFESDSFVEHTITKAISQLGGVAIPMILVVLGANLAPDEHDTEPPSTHHNKIIAASLLSRMVLPSILLLPIIACSVKYIKISILDDPIFLLVAFILTMSPPAIQLSQICQLNEIFEKEMAGVLFWGYVVLTLPTTIFIVVTSLKVIDWAGTTRS